MEKKAGDAKYSWDVFFRGKDTGFGEHIQIWADDASQLQDGRAAMITWLQATEAQPLPRDLVAPRGGGGYARSTPQPNQPAPQPGVSPSCPQCGSEMQMKPGGTVKNPNSANFGKPYGAFWGCTKFPNCNGRTNA